MERVVRLIGWLPRIIYAAAKRRKMNMLARAAILSNSIANTEGTTVKTTIAKIGKVDIY